MAKAYQGFVDQKSYKKCQIIWDYLLSMDVHISLTVNLIYQIWFILGKDWSQLRKQKSSPLHIIQPMGYKILLQKCMIIDPRLPK